MWLDNNRSASIWPPVEPGDNHCMYYRQDLEKYEQCTFRGTGYNYSSKYT